MFLQLYFFVPAFSDRTFIFNSISLKCNLYLILKVQFQYVLSIFFFEIEKNIVRSVMHKIDSLSANHVNMLELV